MGNAETERDERDMKNHLKCQRVNKSATKYNWAEQQPICRPRRDRRPRKGPPSNYKKNTNKTERESDVYVYIATAIANQTSESFTTKLRPIFKEQSDVIYFQKFFFKCMYICKPVQLNPELTHTHTHIYIPSCSHCTDLTKVHVLTWDLLLIKGKKKLVQSRRHKWGLDMRCNSVIPLIQVQPADWVGKVIQVIVDGDFRRSISIRTWMAWKMVHQTKHVFIYLFIFIMLRYYYIYIYICYLQRSTNCNCGFSLLFGVAGGATLSTAFTYWKIRRERTKDLKQAGNAAHAPSAKPALVFYRMKEHDIG